MLPEQFRSEPAFGTNSGVHLVRLLDGHPLLYGIGVSPSLVDMEAFVAPDGNVVEAHYAERSFRPLLELPIRSATEAWQIFLNKADPTGYRYVVNPPEKANDYRIWQRSYPTRRAYRPVRLSLDIATAQPWRAGGQLLGELARCRRASRRLCSPSLPV